VSDAAEDADAPTDAAEDAAPDVTSDAGSDAGADAMADAGGEAGADAGEDAGPKPSDPEEDGGCGCRTVASDGPSRYGAWSLLALAAALVARSRRRRSASG